MVADTRTYSVPIKVGVAVIVVFLGNAFADLYCSNPLTTCCNGAGKNNTPYRVRTM
jgi:hypothetical protein